MPGHNLQSTDPWTPAQRSTAQQRTMVTHLQWLLRVGTGGIRNQVKLIELSSIERGKKIIVV